MPQIRSAEAGFTSADANWYGLACQRSTIDQSIESWAYDTRLAPLCDGTHAAGVSDPGYSDEQSWIAS